MDIPHEARAIIAGVSVATVYRRARDANKRRKQWKRKGVPRIARRLCTRFDAVHAAVPNGLALALYTPPTRTKGYTALLRAFGVIVNVDRWHWLRRHRPMEELERIYAIAHARYRLYMRRLRPDLGSNAAQASTITEQWRKLKAQLEKLLDGDDHDYSYPTDKAAWSRYARVGARSRR